MTRKSHSKLELVFDREQRQEFLTGFSKRKQARRKAARDKLETRYKEEVSRIKKEKRERMKQRLDEVMSVKNSEGVDLAKLAQNELDKEEVLDLPRHIVTITSTEEIDLTNKESAFLGNNTSNAVEVLDITNEEKEDPPPQEKSQKSAETKTAVSLKKSKAKVADLARRTQSLKSKRQRNSHISTGKITKAQKKFLRKKKGGRQKAK